MLNPAAAANVDRVLLEEQRRAALRVSWVRLVAGAFTSVVIWGSIFSGAVTPEYANALEPARYGTLILTGVGALLWLATRMVPRFAEWSCLAIPLIDVPLVSVVQHLQQSRLPAMWQGIPANMAFMCGLVALSILSLSRWVPFLTAAVAVVSIELTLTSAGLPMIQRVLVAVVPFLIAFAGWSVIGRVRTLVQQARKKDLLGKYILGERLGAGGMAEVFLAVYSPEGGFERKVAVKRILPSYAQDADFVAMFRREAELGAMLAHPNVVQVLDFGADSETFFMAMEHVDGLPLSKLIAWCHKNGQHLPLPCAVYIATMLAEAADYIHTRTSPTGIALELVHRDLNPPNVLLSTIGEVKLGDFGIARAITQERLTATGVVRGKYSYSAPEQLNAEPLDARADLFALGVTLHELLTAKRLFTGGSELAVLTACLSGPIAPPSATRPEVPAALDAVVMGLLERERSRRTPSARVLRERLAALSPELVELASARRALGEWVLRARGVELQAAIQTVAERPSEKGPDPADRPTMPAAIRP